MKAYIEDVYPDSSKEYTPMTREELEEKKALLKAQKKEVKKKAKLAKESEEKGLFD